MNKETTAQKIKTLEREMKYWRNAHIKLQEQVIRGREIMYKKFDEINTKESLDNRDGGDYCY